MRKFKSICFPQNHVRVWEHAFEQKERVNKSHGTHYWSWLMSNTAQRDSTLERMRPGGGSGSNNIYCWRLRFTSCWSPHAPTGTAPVERAAQLAMWSAGGRVGRWGASVVLIAHSVLAVQQIQSVCKKDIYIYRIVKWYCYSFKAETLSVRL